MKRLIPFLLLAAAVSASAAEPPREIFPSDYKPLACAPQNACESFTTVAFSTAAAQYLLRNLDTTWVEQHRQEMLSAIGPYCAKRATCLASPGREWWFCNDVFALELRNECSSRFPDTDATHHDYEQCLAFVDTYSAGVDQHGNIDWKTAQACTAKQTAAPATPGKFEWWMIPAVIPADYKGAIRVFAIDTATHVPVPVEIKFENQTVYSTDSPTGRLVAYYTFNWPRRLKRLPRADGHSDVVPPAMTLSAPFYESVSVPVPTVVPKMNVSMTPAHLRKGANKVIVRTVDASTGKPVETEVMLGDETIGPSNKPVTIDIPRNGKHPDLWVTSQFNTYSDVVVLPEVK